MEHEHSVSPETAEPVKQKIRFSKLLNAAWESTPKKIWRLLGIELALTIIMVLAMISYVILGGIVVGLTFLTGVEALVFFVSGILILGLLGVLIWFASWKMAAVYQYLSSGEEQSVLQLVDEAKPVATKIFPTVVLGALVILGGFVALIVPGIILSVSLAFVTVVAVVEKRTLWSALARSRDLVRGHWWNVFFQFLALGVFVILGILTTGGQYSPLAFLLTPVAYIYTYLIYKKLVEFNAHSAPTARGVWYYKVAAVLSALLIVLGLVLGTAAISRNWDELKEVFSEQGKYSNDNNPFEYDYDMEEDLDSAIVN
jgi:hypothetical protein